MTDLSQHKIAFLGGENEITDAIAASFESSGAAVSRLSKQEIAQNQVEESARPSRYSCEGIDFDTAVISPSWFEHIPFLDLKVGDIDAALAQNLEFMTLAAQAAARRLIEIGKGGSIIMLSSVAAKMPMIETNLVGSSLAAMEVIAKMAAHDLAGHKIRVNIVAPGWIPGQWSKPLLDASGAMRTPSDQPWDNGDGVSSVAATFRFLASSESSFITGSVIPVDGGFTLTKSSSKSPYSKPDA